MAVLDDAVDLVIWFERQPDCGTYASDAKVAVQLGWLLGGMTAPKSVATAHRRGGGQSKGDAARVRRARRFVDKNNAHQPFVGYSFGTKRNGAGMRFMLLITPQMGNAIEAHDEAVSEQIGRAVQASNQAASERARVVHKLLEQEAVYITAGKYETALVVHDAVKELQTFGALTMATLQEARRLGILKDVGGLG